jgi:hypothetical protein
MESWGNTMFISMVQTTLVMVPKSVMCCVGVQDATSAVILKLIKSPLREWSSFGPILPSISKLSRTSSVAYFEFRNPTPEPLELLQNITWPQLSTTDGDLYYVNIKDDLEIKNHPKEATYSTWVDLYDSLGFSDFDTY